MGKAMSTPSGSVIINGREYEMHRNLTYLELHYIDASIGLYKKLMLELTRKAQVRKEDGQGPEVWLWKRDGDARLCHIQGFEKQLRWDG